MKSRGKKIILSIVIAILVLLIIAVLGFYAVIQYYYSKSNHVRDEDVTMYSADIDSNSNIEQSDVAGEETEEDTLSSEDEEMLLREQEEVIIPEVSTSGVYNILLIGSDRRDGSWWGNSDSMILMSINHNAKKITLISFMRDLYANIEGVGVRKLNNAYARGGGPLLCSTISSNYGVHIDNYATVDFESMASIIDILGGVDVDMYQAEVDYLNQNTGWGLVEGVNHLNGQQAVAYARIRYVGYYDYERTQRQRKILSLIFDKAKQMDIFTLNEMANQILPYITHNVDQTQLLTLIMQLPSMIGYDLEQDRVPYDDLYSSMGEILVPDFSATIERLHNTIYQ